MATDRSYLRISGMSDKKTRAKQLSHQLSANTQSVDTSQHYGINLRTFVFSAILTFLGGLVVFVLFFLVLAFVY
jgi:hypothetical protein